MAEATPQLSDREREILQLVATGATNQQIANDLGISANTVKVHVRNIFSKIGAASRTEATVFAMRTGIITLAEEQAPPPEVAIPPESPDTPPVVLPEPTPAVPGILVRYRLPIIAGIAALLVLGLMIGIILPRITQPTITSNPTAVGIASNEITATWLQQPDLPVVASGAAAASVDGQIYVIGGASAAQISNRTWRYDPANSAWVSLTEKPTAVTNVQAAVVAGAIYVPGGEMADGSISSVLEVYNPASQAWETKASLPAPRSGYSLVAFEGRIYLFGGWDGRQATAKTYVYDPVADTWSELAPMLTARAYGAAVVVDGKVYVLGGEANGVALTANEQFTPVLNGPGSWTKVTPLQQPRSQFGASALTNNIVVAGGTNQEPPVRYDVRTGTWHPIAAQDIIVGTRPALVTRDASIFVLEGTTNQNGSGLYELRLFYTVTIPITVR
jgi:DNA-binding CsgD family transcriptional regulator